MAQTEQQEYWQEDGKPTSLWHIADSDASTWCRVEYGGDSYTIKRAVPPGAPICADCLREKGHD